MGNKYVTVPISSYNATPPSDDSAQTDNNKVKWSTHKTKIGDPLFNAITAIDAQLLYRFDESAIAKAVNYTTTAGDLGKSIECTSTITISLLDASTGGSSYQVSVVNIGVGVVTVSRATGTDVINGVAGNWLLNPGNGASFRVNSTLDGYNVMGTALTTGSSLADVVHLTGNETIGGNKTLTGTLAGVAANFSGAITGASASVTGAIAGATAAFTGTAVAAAATLATELVTKAQLDAKVYGGRITNGGAASVASVAYGPTGWTASRGSAGVTTVTHSLNTFNYACSPVASTSGVDASITNISNNAFTVTTFTSSTGAVIDSDYNFTMVRN